MLRYTAGLHARMSKIPRWSLRLWQNSYRDPQHQGMVIEEIFHSIRRVRVIDVNPFKLAFNSNVFHAASSLDHLFCDTALQRTTTPNSNIYATPHSYFL